MSEKKVEAFDSHKPLYQLFVWLGYYETETVNRILKYLHTAYRALCLLSILYFNVKHSYYAYYNIYHLNNVQCEAIVTVIADFCFVVKLGSFLFHIEKLHVVNDLIKGKSFAADTKEDEVFLKENIRVSYRLYTVIYGGLVIYTSMWISYRIYLACTTGLHAVKELYYPINLELTRGVVKAIMLQVSKCIWSGAGHIGFDVLVASYYLQAVYQLKLIKYNLQLLFDNTWKQRRRRECLDYLDKRDDDLQRRIVYYIRRYEKVVCFIKHVNDVFGFAIAMHLCLTTIGMCLIIYDASGNIHSSSFLFWAIMLGAFLQQNLFYCFFGSLLEYESDSMNSAIYSSNWLSVSPRFRRMILIAMSRWHYPIIIRVAGLVPLSLNTFVSMCRLAYSMFTVLVSLN